MIPEVRIGLINPVEIIHNHARIVHAPYIVNHFVNSDNERLPIIVNAGFFAALPSEFIIQARTQKASGENGKEKSNQFWQTCCESFPQDLADVVHYSLVMLVVTIAVFLSLRYQRSKP
jgi:hypothetical protein